MKDRSSFWQTWQVLLLCIAAKLLIHLIVYAQYGYHRDELLYVMLGEHLSWGYMSVPPFIAVLGNFARSLLGETLFAVRILPALAGCLLMGLVWGMVKEMGGKKWAEWLACIGLLVSPALLGSNHLFQPVSFNQLFWTLSAFWLVRYLTRGEAICWLWLGITAGVGMMNKYSMAFMIMGLLMGVLVDRRFAFLRTSPFWLGGALGLLILLPNLLWQHHYEWPLFKHMAELAETQLVHVQASDFLLSQLTMQLWGSLLWGIGLLALLFMPALERYRSLAWAYIAVVLLILSLSGKAYYTLGAYPMLYAAGAVAVEQIRRRPSMKYLPHALLVILPLGNLPLLPYALPLLPVEKAISYFGWMAEHAGLNGPLRGEDGTYHELTQDYADMYGWPEIAEAVTKTYEALPPEEQAQCLIYGGGYGHAAAVDVLGSDALPPARSFNASYLFWTPQHITAQTFIWVDDGADEAELNQMFEQVSLIGTVEHPLARERGLRMYLLQNPRLDVQALWADAYRKEWEERLGQAR